MKREKFRHWAMRAGIYPVDVHLVVCPAKTFGKWIEARYKCKDGYPESRYLAECLELSTEGMASDFVLWFRRFSRVPVDMYILVHETHHLADKILRHLSIPLIDGDGNDEAAAYLQEWLFRECWRRMAK